MKPVQPLTEDPNNLLNPGINRQNVYLIFVAVFFLIGVVWIRLRLLGLPLERDEGEYAYMAQQLLQGVLPYTESQSMKFPGIYIAYAGVLAIFGESPVAIHLSLLFLNLATAFLLFLLGRDLFSPSAGVVAGVSFSILTLSPDLQGIWANSEHFLLLPALGGILLLQKNQDKPARFFFSGLLLGIALLIKQHAVFFCLFGVIQLGYKVLNNSQPLKSSLKVFGLFALGGIIPITFSATLYAMTGNFSDFWFCTVQYASEYVSSISLSQGLELFKKHFGNILESNLPILLFSMLGLVRIFSSKNIRQEKKFLISFFVFSFLAITPGLYFRQHYFLLWMPSFALLAGVGFESVVSKLSSSRFRTNVPIGILIFTLGLPILIQKEFFFTLPITEATRQTYSLNPFPESLEIAKYIREHSQKDDRIAVFGSEPQIYFYAQRKSVTRYIYMYPLMEKHSFARSMQEQMIREVKNSQPRFIVMVNVESSWLIGQDSIPLILNWAEDYIDREYKISGTVDILSEKETIYKWGEQAKGYLPKSTHYILIYKRLA
jgi:hypothetical protein